MHIVRSVCRPRFLVSAVRAAVCAPGPPGSARSDAYLVHLSHSESVVLTVILCEYPCTIVHSASTPVLTIV
jgi:hypothetical protein